MFYLREFGIHVGEDNFKNEESKPAAGEVSSYIISLIWMNKNPFITFFFFFFLQSVQSVVVFAEPALIKLRILHMAMSRANLQKWLLFIRFSWEGDWDLIKWSRSSMTLWWCCGLPKLDDCWLINCSPYFKDTASTIP